MNIALFGKTYSGEQTPFVQMLINELGARKANISFYKPYFDKFGSTLNLPSNIGYFNRDILWQLDSCKLHKICNVQSYPALDLLSAVWASNHAKKRG